METYLTAKITASAKEGKGILKFLTACGGGDADEIKGLGCQFGNQATGILQMMLKNEIYLEYFEGISVSADKKLINMEATCGSKGLDFLINIVELIGPSAKKIEANFKHDEEFEEPICIEYSKGALKINGKPYFSEPIPDENEKLQECRMSKFNIIGPELNDSELKPLRDICNKALLANSKNPLFYLKTFEEICAELVELEKKHESGVEINIENNEEFRELAETCGGFLVRCSFRISLCSYYFAMIRSISEENQLGTCILRFHEPWLFSGAIIGLIQDGLIKCNPPGEITQQDFDRWKKNLLIFVKKEWEYQY